MKPSFEPSFRRDLYTRLTQLGNFFEKAPQTMASGLHRRASMKVATMRWGWCVGVVVIAMAPVGCGKGSTPDILQDSIPVDGATVTFTSQCPYGTVSAKTTAQLGLKNCNGSSKFQLAKNPAPIQVKADCREKTVTFRSSDRTVDSSWNTYPDGSFDVGVTTGAPIYVRLGNGSTCVTWSSVRLRGSVACRPNATDENIDQVQIEFSTEWEFGKGTKPTDTTGEMPECRFPSGCELVTQATVNQCM
jgi:hypothetical protein